MDTQDQILRQCRAGEDSRAEFKEVRFGKQSVVSPNSHDMAGEMVAFANGVGGILFLGVSDSGGVVGIPPERVGLIEKWLVNIASNNCVPLIRPTLRRELLPDDAGGERHVMLAEVPRGNFVHRTVGGRYLVRVGSTKRDLDPPELARLFQDRGRGYVFDEQPVFAADVNDLDWNRLESFFGRSPTIPWLDLLRNARVIVPEN